MGGVSFTFHDVEKFSLDELFLGTFLQTIFVDEHIPFGEVSYIFCSDEYLIGMNREFLGHDTYTDILTFTLSEPNRPVISEIYISTERVRENASKFSVKFTHELNRVMIHGMLHLCGYSDHTIALKEEMTRKEDEYLEKLGST